MFAVLSVYLTDPVSKGGLGFSQEQRGVMQAVVTALLYLLPILGGAIADRFGYRKVLLAAFVTLASGYFAMGQFHAYAPFFIAFLVVAVGGAIFKPIIVATVSKTTAKGQDTLGFGIFYMIVNIGGFAGPFMAKLLRDINWVYVFIMCAGVIILNLVLLSFYREPGKSGKKIEETFSKSLAKLFKNLVIVLKDRKFVLYLIIMVGMWVMYMQLFFTLPVYITQWIDTTGVFNNLGFLKGIIGSIEDGVGLVRPELMINVPAFCIILFQVIVSNRVSKFSPITTMVVGIFVIAIAYAQMSFQLKGGYIMLSLVVLAFGEMVSSPRIQEYIGRIAPKDKVALYMGYSFLPLAGGNLLGGLLSGTLYGSLSDKYAFLRDYLVGNGFDSLDRINGLDDAVLFSESCERLNMTVGELNQVLYSTYQPGTIWLVFAGIGLGTSILLWAYNRYILSK
jgi:dipeptide/tripeptide permease